MSKKKNKKKIQEMPVQDHKLEATKRPDSLGEFLEERVQLILDIRSLNSEEEKKRDLSERRPWVNDYVPFTFEHLIKLTLQELKDTLKARKEYYKKEDAIPPKVSKDKDIKHVKRKKKKQKLKESVVKSEKEITIKTAKKKKKKKEKQNPNDTFQGDAALDKVIELWDKLLGEEGAFENYIERDDIINFDYLDEEKEYSYKELEEVVEELRHDYA